MTIPQRAYDEIEGLSVFTVDDEEIGVVERLLVAPDDPTQHYLVIRSAALAGVLGVEVLYVPDTDIHAVEADRVVLETTAEAPGRPDWATPPFDIGLSLNP